MTSLFAQSFPAPPTPFNMAAYVLGTGAKDATALCEIGGRHPGPIWTYATLRSAVAGTATGLLAWGLTPGDRVLLRMNNSVDVPITYLACIWAGLLPVPTAAGLTPAELDKMVAQIAPRAIATSPGVALPNTDVPHLSARRLAAMRDLPPAAPDVGDPERPAYIVFTSGSSGASRAVCHAHRAVWARRMMWEGWYGLRRTDRMLHAGAFNWTYTMGTGLMDPWAIGATALIPADGTPATALPALLARHKATLFAAAPGIYRQMLREPLPPLPHLRHGLSAGEALPCALRTAWEAATGTPVHEALGMSECSTYVSGSPARPAPMRTAGYPQPGRHLAVIADGAPVPLGTTGTLAIHRSDPGLMLGYWEDGAPKTLAGAWFETGDQVCMGPDHAITYLGRVDDMMNAGGFRVSPLEVEAALADVPGLREIAVAEVRVSDTTTLIAAFHVGATQETLTARAQTTLARYKQPRLWIALDALPRNANGKINRRALRAHAVTSAPTHGEPLANHKRLSDEGE